MTQIDERPATTAAETAEKWLAAFNGALEKGDTAAVSELFLETSFWRDLVAFTWNITTVEGPRRRRRPARRTRSSAPTRRASHRPSRADRGRRRHRRPGSRSRPRSGAAAACCGCRRGRRQAWTLLTTLYELKGHEEPRDRRRPDGRRARRQQATATTWLERRAAGGRRARQRRRSPYVLVIGGGQGGIALGARLRQLGVPTLVDRQARAPR